MCVAYVDIPRVVTVAEDVVLHGGGGGVRPPTTAVQWAVRWVVRGFRPPTTAFYLLRDSYPDSEQSPRREWNEW